MQLKGKTALIAGADLILVARTLGDQLKEVAQECQARGAQTLHLLADVGDPRQVESVVEQGLNRFGKVDLLACVAAIRPHRPFWEVSDEEWGQLFAINTHSTSSALMRRASASRAVPSRGARSAARRGFSARGA